VLSACNTGSGAGAGAEAASGLGRAFFYAGTRALLVTNWSVHSASARELVSDLFRRQAQDTSITRSEALKIYRRLLSTNPGNAIAELKLVVALTHIGRLKGAEGRADRAEALAIVRALDYAGRLNEKQRNWITELEQEIASRCEA